MAIEGREQTETSCLNQLSTDLYLIFKRSWSPRRTFLLTETDAISHGCSPPLSHKVKFAVPCLICFLCKFVTQSGIEVKENPGTQSTSCTMRPPSHFCGTVVEKNHSSLIRAVPTLSIPRSNLPHTSYKAVAYSLWPTEYTSRGIHLHQGHWPACTFDLLLTGRRWHMDLAKQKFLLEDRMGWAWFKKLLWEERGKKRICEKALYTGYNLVKILVAVNAFNAFSNIAYVLPHQISFHKQLALANLGSYNSRWCTHHLDQGYRVHMDRPCKWSAGYEIPFQRRRPAMRWCPRSLNALWTDGDKDWIFDLGAAAFSAIYSSIYNDSCSRGSHLMSSYPHILIEEWGGRR